MENNENLNNQVNENNVQEEKENNNKTTNSNNIRRRITINKEKIKKSFLFISSSPSLVLFWLIKLII